MPEREEKMAKNENVAVFEELQKAGRLYDEYLELTHLQTLPRLNEAQRGWSHRPDLPLSLTIVDQA